jgi:hypothetical protein
VILPAIPDAPVSGQSCSLDAETGFGGQQTVFTLTGLTRNGITIVYASGRPEAAEGEGFVLINSQTQEAAGFQPPALSLPEAAIFTGA